jgi:drug efflux transport system permease protein
MSRGLRAVIIKEFRHLRRDPMSLVYILLVPFIMIWLYGYGINLDIREVRTDVVDHSGGPQADRLIRMMAGSGVFIPERITPRSGTASSIEASERRLKEGKVREILIIPPDFDKNLLEGKTAEVGLILDGSDARSALSIGRLQERLMAAFIDGLGRGLPHDPVRTRIAFNPEGKSALSLIPGLFAIILIVISALLTSVAMARERESGAIEILYLAPLPLRDLILGKAVPYILISFFDGAPILALARLWFHIPFRGSLPAMAFLSLLYIMAGAGTGLLISALVTTQRDATIAEALTTLLPSFFLSGFIIPLESLSPFLRGISYLVPAAYFIKIVRAILLKGSGIQAFVFETAALAVYAAVLFSLALWAFSRRRAAPR